MTHQTSRRNLARLHVVVPSTGPTTVSLDKHAVDIWTERAGGKDKFTAMLMEIGRKVKTRAGLSRSTTFYLEFENELGAV